jgi:1,4-dihydroxy-2-naphthoate octaprenyltransferase
MGHFSYRTGMAIYRFESLIAFVILAVLLIIGYAPWPCAFAFLSAYDLYVVLMNSSKAAEDKHASFMLVPLCFKLNWHFGVLLSVGYLLYWTLLL